MAFLLHRLSVVVVAAGFVAVGGACSSAHGDGAATQQTVEGACEHLNGICASTKGFQQQDCSGTTAAYAKLSPQEKAQTDAVVPCVMAANSCQPALDCVRKASSSTTSPTTSNTTSKTDAGAACEHINSVCQGQSGFSTQDCSGSNAAYAQLNAQEKAAADAIAPCIMQAQSCQSALACLKQASQ